MNLQGILLRRLLAGISLIITPVCAQIVSFPYSESFDAVVAPALPSGWTTTTNRTAAGDFGTTTSGPRSAPNCVLSTNSTIAQTLVSPTFNFTNRVPDRLQFYSSRSSTHTAGLLVEASTDNGATFPLQLADTIKNPGTTSYVLTTISLPPSLANQPTVKFRWRLVPSATGTTGTFRIDDLSLTIQTSFDLALRSISTVPALPTTRDSLMLNARVRNLGVQTATGYAVEFYRDANNNAAPEAGERFAFVAGPSLAPGDSALVTAAHPRLPFGDHRFYAIINFAQDEAQGNDTLSTLVSVGYAPGAVLINEIMYAPLGDEPEWVEFFNATSDTINMRSWRISDNNVGTKTVMSATDFRIAPGNYAIVARDANFATVHPSVSVPVAIANFSALNNTTPDAVVLYDNRLATIDSVLYSPSWGGQGGKSLERIDVQAPTSETTNWGTSLDSTGRTPGRENSIAKKNIDLALGEIVAGSSISGTTVVPSITYQIRNLGRHTVPGGFGIVIDADTNRNGQFEPNERIGQSSYPDSILPGQTVVVVFSWGGAPQGETLVRVAIILSADERQSNNVGTVAVRRRYEQRSMIVNEIMYDPLAGQNEWVEFYHRGVVPIDIARWQFADRPTSSGSINTFTVTTTSRIIQPGEFVVVAADSTLLTLYPWIVAAPGVHLFILNRSGGFSFGNDGDDIVLRDPTGAVIDSVSYSPRWHHPDINDTKGRSLERINPHLDSNDPRNWSTATPLEGGTPGKPNSIFTAAPQRGSTLSISPNPFSPDGDGFEDFCIIRYSLPTTTALIRVRIFDIRGRTIRTLANLEPSSAEGSLVWDGLDDTRQRIRIGTYIVLVEAADGQNQNVASARAVVVVATKL